jgi:hypothetical protein
MTNGRFLPSPRIKGYAPEGLRPIGDQAIDFSHGQGYAPEGLRPVGDQAIGFSHGQGYAPEGAKRRYPAHFTSKLTDADAELQETQHWLMRAKAYGYLSPMAFDSVWQSAKQVGRRLGSMLKSGDWA